jgi:hypothetical protein
MSPSEKFLRFAAECEHMAQFTRTPENKTVWTSMAERWIRCAELIDQQSAQTHRHETAKRHRRAAPGWAH